MVVYGYDSAKRTLHEKFHGAFFLFGFIVNLQLKEHFIGEV